MEGETSASPPPNLKTSPAWETTRRLKSAVHGVSFGILQTLEGRKPLASTARFTERMRGVSGRVVLTERELVANGGIEENMAKEGRDWEAGGEEGEGSGK